MIPDHTATTCQRTNLTQQPGLSCKRRQKIAYIANNKTRNILIPSLTKLCP